MNTKHLILGAAVAGAVCGLDAKTVIYSNDFATRTSVVKAEPGPWRTYAYTVGGRLAYSYAATWYNYTPDIHWADPTQAQDGWALGGAGGYQEDAGGNFPGVHVFVNDASECPGDTTHPFGAFRLNSEVLHTWCRAVQPIGNSFSNGVVRYSVDMRPPQVWGAKWNGGWGPLFRFYPAFRRDLRRPEIGGDPEENPCAIGFAQNTATDSPGNALVQGAKRNIRYANPSENYFGGTVEPGHWYRCHVTLDIDRATCFMSMDDMGGTVPSWDSTPVQADVLRMDTAMPWRYAMTAERGPIDGIAFQAEGVNSMNVVTNMPSFTNIKVEWKAPGTDAFLSCYENDFTVCRKRTLQPPAPTFAYPEITTATVSADNTAYPYDSLWNPGRLPASGENWLLVTKPLRGGTAPEAVGFDNWRRIYTTGWAFATVATYDGNNVLRASWPYGPGDTEGVYGCFAQPLGETLTSGKVRMLVDMRTPDRFWFTANSGLYVCLGDANHHSSYGDAGSMATYVTCAGIGCGGETLCYPEYKTNNTWPNGKGDCTCETSRWYRVETVVDLDAQTWGFSVFDLEGGTPDLPVFTRSDLAYAHPAAQRNVAAFSISAYGPGYKEDGVMLFDNIQVWKNWNAQEGTGDELYRNDFTTRTRPSVRMAENLGDAPNVVSDEKDRWTIRCGDADWVKRVKGENGNPCASFFCLNCNTHAMQDFGTAVRSGKLTVSADIRPPSVWHKGGDGRDAGVYVGGAELAQGNRFGGAEIWAAAATGFGFDGGGSPYDATEMSHVVTAYCQNGREAPRFGFVTDPSHWYRFKATFDLRTKKVGVNVYDMGTEHPGLDTPDGRFVGSMENLAFVNDQVEELTTVCLRGVGLRTDSPWMAEDSGSAFFDNLKAEVTPLGCAIIVR